MWIADISELRSGDIIGHQFGADSPPLDRVEWLDDDRARLHFADGTTGRARKSDGRVRLTNRSE